MKATGALAFITIAVVGSACSQENSTEQYPSCQADLAPPVPTENFIPLDSPLVEFDYSVGFCYYVLGSGWDEGTRLVRVMGTVQRLLDTTDSAPLRQRSCTGAWYSCQSAPIIELTVHHDFDGIRLPGTRLYVFVGDPLPEDARDAYVGNRVILFGSILDPEDSPTVIASVPAILTIHNCYAFASNPETLTAEFGDRAVTEKEVVDLVERTIDIGIRECRHQVHAQ